MKKALLVCGILLASYLSHSQTSQNNYYADYPVQDIKEKYDENFQVFYNVKLVNKTKKEITSILFLLEPTWLDGDTQLMKALRAEKSIKVKANVSVKPGQTFSYNLETPSNKYSVTAKIVRYIDGNIKNY